MLRWAIKEYMRSSSTTITDICTETHLSYIITRQNNGPVHCTGTQNQRSYDRFYMP